jgi:hypothetical protein
LRRYDICIINSNLIIKLILLRRAKLDAFSRCLHEHFNLYSNGFRIIILQMAFYSIKFQSLFLWISIIYSSRNYLPFIVLKWFQICRQFSILILMDIHNYICLLPVMVYDTNIYFCLQILLRFRLSFFCWIHNFRIIGRHFWNTPVVGWPVCRQFPF